MFSGVHRQWRFRSNRERSQERVRGLTVLPGAFRAVASAAVVLVLVVPGCGGESSRELALEACTVDGAPARCGTVMVPEDRSGDGDQQLPVRVVVFPATGPDRQPDPVVWFAGGPGDSAVDGIGRVRPLLAPNNTSRDLVFIEQRGTGASALTCPAFPDASDSAALRSAVESCVDSLDGDPRFYTTSLFADDVDEILAGLDYAQANLIGISYGTTAEQVFLARHQDRVRTMTLLSGTLLDIPVLERFPESAQTAIDNVFAECERDAACQQAFPQLRADWDAMWASVNAAPWVVPADRSPDRIEHVFDADFLATGMHDLLFVATTHTRMPLLVHTLGAADDKVDALLAIAQAYPDTPEAASGDEQMLRYLIRCNEAWARYNPDQLVGTDSFEYEHNRQDAEWWQSVCALIPEASDDDAAIAAPPNSDVPVLALNGEIDPQDPPANMASASAVWPNSLALVVPGQGHDIDPTSASCIIPLIQAFIDQSSMTDLETNCLSQLPPPAFDLTLPNS
jgi:pimeloyl-ACP methyl ester carboxylesterase